MTIHNFPGNDPEPDPLSNIVSTVCEAVLRTISGALGHRLTVGEALAALADMPLKDVIDAMFPPTKAT